MLIPLLAFVFGSAIVFAIAECTLTWRCTSPLTLHQRRGVVSQAECGLTETQENRDL